MAAGEQVLGSAVVNLRANTAQFQAGMKASAASTRQLQGVAAAASSQVATFARVAAAGAAGVAVFAGIQGVRAGIRSLIEFDQAMTQSIAIMRDVDDVMRGRMAAAARQVGEDLNFAAREGAEAFFFLASAGLDAEQSLAALPAVAEFARAGMFDFARATDLATDAQSALGLTVKNAQQNLKNLTRVTDVLVRANTLANATVEQFSTALTSEAGAALKTFRKDIEEGVAVLAAFADQGVKAEVAGSSLSRILRLMGSAAVNNAAAYKELEIAVFDGSGRMRNMADIIEDLEDALLGMSDETRIAALESLGFQARVQGVINPLLGTSDAIRRYEAELRKAGGTTKQIAENQMQSLENRLGKLRQEFVNWRTSVLENVVPAIEAFVEHAGTLVDVLTVLAAVAGGKLLVAIARKSAALIASTAATVAAATAEKARLTTLANVALAEQASARAALVYAGGLTGEAVAANVASGSLARLTAASRAAAVAQTQAAAATSGFVVAIRGLFSAIGPTGWLLLGIGAVALAFSQYRRDLKEAREEQEKFDASLQTVRTQLQGLSRDATTASIANLEGALVEAEVAAVNAASSFAALLERQKAIEARGAGGDIKVPGLAEAGAEFAAAEAHAQTLRDMIAAAESRLAALNAGGLETLQGEFDRASAEADRYVSLLAQAQARLERYQAAAKASPDLFPADLPALQEAQEQVDFLTERLQATQAEVERLAEVLGIDLSGAADEANGAISDLVESLRLQLAAEERLLQATAGGEKALEQANREIERARDLHDALAQAEAGEEAEIRKLINAIHDARDARAAEARIQEDLKSSRDAEIQARRDSVRAFKDSRREMSLQVDAQERLIAAQEVGEGAIRNLQIEMAGEQAARALGIAATKREQEEVRKLAEELERLAGKYDAVQKKQKDAADAALREAQRLAEPWEEALRSIQQGFSGAFNELLSGELKTWEDFADQVLGIFTNLVSQLGALFVQDALGITDLLDDIRKEGIDAIGGVTGALKSAGKLLAGAGAGFTIGAASGSGIAGALSGVITGALAGGIPGAVLGGVGGILGGAFGGDDAAEKARLQAIEQANDALRSFGDSLKVVTALERNRATATKLLGDALDATLKDGFRIEGIDSVKLSVDSSGIQQIARHIEEIVQAGGGVNEVFASLTEGFGSLSIADDVLKELRPSIAAFVEDLRLVQEAFDREQAAIGKNLQVEALRLQGLEQEAIALESQIAIQEALAAGWTDANIAALQHVQALKEEARILAELDQLSDLELDFDEVFKRAVAESNPGDIGAQIDLQKFLGEINIDETVAKFQDLVDANRLTQDELDQLEEILGQNLVAALEATAAAAERAAAALEFSIAQTDLDIEARRKALAGDDRGAFAARLQKEAAAEVQRYKDLLDASGITAEQFAELAEIIGLEVVQALEEFDEAARQAARAAQEAAKAEQLRALVDTQSIRVRLLELQGRSREALLLQQQIELLQAIQAERGAEYIAILQQIHAIQLRNLAEEDARQAQEAAASAAEKTAQELRGVAEALNAPSGFRLSLRKWQAAIVGEAGGPSFEQFTGLSRQASALGGTFQSAGIPAGSFAETQGFAASTTMPAQTTVVQNHVTNNNFPGGVTIRISEKDSEAEVLAKWKRALTTTTRRGAVNPATVGPSLTNV